MSIRRLEILPILDNGAACAENTIFNRPGLEGEGPKARTSRIKAAKAICATCPVAEKCLRWALDHPTQAQGSVWGGKTDSERKRLRAAEVAAIKQAALEVTEIPMHVLNNLDPTAPAEISQPPQQSIGQIAARPLVDIVPTAPIL